MPDTFQWSLSKRAYSRRSNGRVVTQARLNGWVSDLQSGVRANLRQIGRDLLAGNINRAEFALRVGAELKNLHRSLGLLAAGGRDQMGAREWGRIGGILNRELSYFNRLASTIDNIELDTLGGTFLNRLSSYAEAGWVTYQNAVRAREMEVGSEERSVLGDSAQSCDECIEQDALDWQPSGTLIPIGDRTCGPRCNCGIEFRDVSVANQEEDSEAA